MLVLLTSPVSRSHCDNMHVGVKAVVHRLCACLCDYCMGLDWMQERLQKKKKKQDSRRESCHVSVSWQCLVLTSTHALVCTCKPRATSSVEGTVAENSLRGETSTRSSTMHAGSWHIHTNPYFIPSRMYSLFCLCACLIINPTLLT